jgi:hypothetical protein
MRKEWRAGSNGIAAQDHATRRAEQVFEEYERNGKR